MLAQHDVLAIRGPVAARSASDHALLGKRLNARQQRQGGSINAGGELGTLGHLQRVAQQAKAGDIRQGVHARQLGQIGARAVQLRGGADHGGVAGGIEQFFFERGRQNAHAQRFAQNQHVARLGIGVALELPGIHDTNGHQPVNGFDRVDRMPARQRDARSAADAGPTFQNGRNGAVRQHIDRHANNGQRHQRRGPHGVNIRQRIGGGDAAKVVRVIDDGHEKIGRRHNRLVLIDAIDGSIVGRFGADQ